MEFGVAAADLRDRLETLKNLPRLERDHPAERDVAIADVLERAYRMTIRARAPSLSHAERRKAKFCRAVLPQELSGEREGDFLPFPDCRWRPGGTIIPSGLVHENHMVD